MVAYLFRQFSTRKNRQANPGSHNTFSYLSKRKMQVDHFGFVEMYFVDYGFGGRSLELLFGWLSPFYGRWSNREMRGIAVVFSDIKLIVWKWTNGICI